jgi:hypothetical protein
MHLVLVAAAKNLSDAVVRSSVLFSLSDSFYVYGYQGMLLKEIESSCTNPKDLSPVLIIKITNLKYIRKNWSLIKASKIPYQAIWLTHRKHSICTH